VTLKVDRRANRLEIKDAVEKNFNTRVKQVRTVQVKGKVKQRGRIIGKRKDWKKAVVTLMPGQRIDFFEGV
jgi:large subunit ribosomal protein L23